MSAGVLGVLIFAWMSLASPLNVFAQNAAPLKSPIVLDRKTAGQLALSQTIPEYPALAKVNYIQGQVRMELMISRDGQVTQAHILHGHPFLATSALKAVRHWLYRPFESGGHASPFLTTVNVNFTLRTRKVELLPRQPETDLNRQVKPPQTVSRPSEDPGASSVRLRLLINEQGQVVDAEPLKGPAAALDAARKSISHWTFRPAQWGTLPVPWYVDVDVPVTDPAVREALSEPAAR
jgi:TonB family protein